MTENSCGAFYFSLRVCSEETDAVCGLPYMDVSGCALDALVWGLSISARTIIKYHNKHKHGLDPEGCVGVRYGVW